MAPSRLIFTALGALWALGTLSVFATGGDYDEVPYALDYYLDRIPAKSVSQIFRESGYTASKAKPVELPRQQLIHDFAQGPSPKLVAEIDQLLVASRSPYAGPDQVNLLQDFRDLAANAQATGAEMSAYVQWRFDHLDVFKKNPPEQYDDSKKTPPSASQVDIDAKATATSKAMLPHWLYLEGAYLYLGGDDTKSEPYFDRVLNEFPDSGRAEPALFMKGRCKLSQTCTSGDDGTGIDAAKASPAKTLFQSYLTKYPQGRYTSDVLGWLGGVGYRSTDPATALDFYTRQLEMKDHPENFGSALVMIEKVLARQKPESEATMDQVAQHPPIALALAYFALNFTQPKDDQNDQDYQAFNTWRHGVLPKLGQAVLKHKDLYQGAAWQDRYLAILAQAASDHGDQKQALDLIAMGGKSGVPSDDYLFAKALVLQRAKQLADAESTYRELLAKFPDSPLARGAGYRLALALHDQGRDGEALLQLAALRKNQLTLRDVPGVTPPPETDDIPDPTDISAIGIDYSGAPDEEVSQTMDAILNFAPLTELEKALKLATGRDQSELRNDLGQILQERYLDHDDFRNAARFTNLPQAKAKWTYLADKSDALDRPIGPVDVKGAMEMADFWVANRVMLPALPLDSIDARATIGFRDDAATHRAANAVLLAYSQPEVELESREGLWHAIKWWGKASATNDPVAAPTALWSIVKARRTIAEVNPYTWARAISGGAAADSKGDYKLLLAKYPDSPEAKRLAAYWTIAGDFTHPSSEKFSVGYDRDTLSDDWVKAMNVTKDEYFYDDSWKTTEDAINHLAKDSANMDGDAFAREIYGMRSHVGANATTLEDADVMNCLDDLVAVSQVDGLDAATRTAYINARIQLLYGGDPDGPGQQPPQLDLASVRKQPGAQKIADFIEFLDIAQTAHEEVEVPVKDLDKDGQPLTFTSRNYQGLLTKTTAFLAKYPKSVKREPARLLQLRALVRLSRPREVPWTLDWPAVNQWDDEYAPRFLTLAPFDAKTTNAAFRAYDAEFPHGQYVNAVLALRADSELIQQHWDNALDNLLALLDQQTSPELHAGAAGELAYIFDQIDKEDRRDAVLTEILKRPAARKDLASYVATGGLPELADYVNAKLAAAK